MKVMTKPVGKRERKSAKIKLDIMFSSMELIGNQSFKDLYVDDICERAGVSKVTLFKYFPQKEDILLYYMRIWSLDRAVELYHQPRTGLKGIYFLFDRMAEAFEKYPGLALNVISYWTSARRPPSAFPLKPLERKILYPKEENLDDIEVFTVPQLLEKFLLDAIMNREIHTVSDARELSNLFMSLLYGTLITAHLRQLSPLRMVFRKNIDMTLKGLQTPGSYSSMR